MATNSGKFVCYYRVSTGRQGKSGLGLDAQRAAVATYLNGGDWQIVEEFTEVESGKNSDRPALEKALAAARLHRACRFKGGSLDPIGGVSVTPA
jgi:DNA invertase Pin-like site-specific DNA recombinase